MLLFLSGAKRTTTKRIVAVVAKIVADAISKQLE
jgi:hypothetical protein